MPDSLYSSSPHDPRLAESADAESLAPPPSSSPNLDSNITDELTDHLALASRDLQLAGHSPGESRQLAQQKFGDIAAIRRRLWWIHQGDEIMLRTALAVIVVVLILAVAALGVGNWRMNQAISDLGSTLSAMNETQRSLLDSQLHQNRPAEIRGMCYLGQRSRPAENVDVAIYELPDMKVVRRVATDADGKFRSGFLPTGEYLILVTLIGEANPLFPFGSDESNIAADGPVYRMQSAPMTVYPGMHAPPIELNVQMIDVGQLSFELASAVPDQLAETASDTSYRVGITVQAIAEPGPPTLPIDPLKSATAHSWPLVGVYRHGLGGFYRTPSSFAEQPPAYNEWTPLPAKKYNVSVFFQANTQSLPSQSISGFGYAAMPPGTRPATEVEVKPGQRTHLRIIPPEA